MGSSNIVDSGRSAGHKSNFNQTCSLLSQYFKEKGSLGDLNIEFNNMELKGATSNTKTMNLLPMIEKAGQMPEFQGVANPQPENSQLTIFYAGKVLVFNDFPADKVEEIMHLAPKGIPPNAKTFTCDYVHNPPEEPVTPVVPSFDINMVQANLSQTALSTKISDLPIARKNSLTRFLEKRKDRVTARAPYNTDSKGVAISKPAAENKPWLGMAAEAAGGGGGGGGAQFPLQINRHR